jgi:hypothetical protein
VIIEDRQTDRQMYVSSLLSFSVHTSYRICARFQFEIEINLFRPLRMMFEMSGINSVSYSFLEGRGM